MGKISLKKAQEQTIPNQLFWHVPRWDKCHMLLLQTQPLPKVSVCSTSVISKTMRHSRGSICKDFSEIKVQITSKGTLIRPVELTARLINYLQVFWSVLKHFLFQLYLNFDVFVLPGVQLSVFLVPNMLGSSYSSFCVSDRNGEL